MERRALPLNALRTFEAVARNLSFTRAATELGVTHGAVSRQIIALETSMRMPLFLRESSRIRLTTEGSRLFAGVAPALDRIAATMDSLQDTTTARVLSVNAPPTFTMRWLIPRLTGFQRANQNAEVRLATGTGLLQSLRMNDYDVVIRRMQHDDDAHRAQPFLSGALVAVASPDLIGMQTITTLNDLAPFRLIEAATNSVGWPEWFERAGGSMPTPTRFLRLEEMFYAVQAALDGLGVALVPSALVVDDLAAGRLQRILAVPGVYERDYCHVVSPVSRNPELARAFCTWLDHEGQEARRLSQSVMGDGA